MERAPRSQDRVYHDLLSSPETLAVRGEVRAFADTEVAPLAREIGQAEESVEAFPHGLFKQMAGQGLFRIPFAREHGGRGLDRPVSATVAAIEELSYVSSSVAAIYDVHCILAGHVLVHGSSRVHRDYLEPLLTGTRIGSFATTEPEASSDLSPQTVQTVAVLDGAGYRISGHKRWITNAPVADFCTVLCRTGDTLTEFVVDLHGEGVQVGAPDKKLGNRGQLTADLYFDGAPVSADHVIGAVGQGLRIALATLTYGRVGIAASGVGMAQSGFDEAMAHLLSRRAFGRQLAAFQHWQFRMAERATQLENARNLYLKAARRMDDGVTFPEPEAGMAKYYGTELAVDMARDAVQILGGYGYMRELAHDGSASKVEELYRDSKVAEIYEGTNEIQRWIIARTLFGKAVTG